MSKEGIEVGRFAFGIRLVQQPDGKMLYEANSIRENIPVEVVLMQLRAFIRNLENEYFDNWDRGTAKFKKD